MHCGIVLHVCQHPPWRGRFWFFWLVQVKMWTSSSIRLWWARAVLTKAHNSCPPSSRLSVYLASWMRVRITTSGALTPTATTLSYRFSRSTTNEHSTSRVATSEGEGEDLVRGFGRYSTSMKLGTLVVSGICQAKNRFNLSIIAANRLTIDNIK